MITTSTWSLDDGELRENLLGEFVLFKCAGELAHWFGIVYRDCTYGDTGERNMGLWCPLECTGDAIGLCHLGLLVVVAPVVIAPGDLLGENIIDGGMLILILVTKIANVYWSICNHDILN